MLNKFISQINLNLCIYFVNSLYLIFFTCVKTSDGTTTTRVFGGETKHAVVLLLI